MPPGVIDFLRDVNFMWDSAEGERIKRVQLSQPSRKINSNKRSPKDNIAASASKR